MFEDKIYVDKDYESWVLWEDFIPPTDASGSVEAIWYFDGNQLRSVIRLYHYVDGTSKWGYSTKVDGKWKTEHPPFFRWRYINEEIPSLEQQGSSILVWHWNDAPGKLRSHSTHGGDEDWVALIPVGMEVPFWMESGSFSISSSDEIKLEDGRILIITAHA